jgi:hypothetical protein
MDAVSTGGKPLLWELGLPRLQPSELRVIIILTKIKNGWGEFLERS